MSGVLNRPTARTSEDEPSAFESTNVWDGVDSALDCADGDPELARQYLRNGRRAGRDARRGRR